MMKPALFAATVVLLFTASVTRAQEWDNAADGARTIADATTTNRRADNFPEASATVLSLFDRDIVKAFNRAWQRAALGTTPVEAVVLLVRHPDGSCKAISPNPTREYRRFTFRWQPGTIAVLHTHPNGSAPQPQPADIEIAERFHVPIFTLTKHGMFLYDPMTKAISKVQDGVDWLEYSKWARPSPLMAAKPATRP